MNNVLQPSHKGIKVSTTQTIQKNRNVQQKCNHVLLLAMM